jgi:hypothetical protein
VFCAASFRAEGTGMTPPDLDVYDIAFLAGGMDRVVDTALVALVRSGRVRVHSPGQLATAELTRRHPVEAAVLDAVGPTGHRSVDTICWRLVDDDRLQDIGQRLRGRGLMGRGAAVVAGLLGGRRSLAPTRAGRQVLKELDDLPGVDAEAMRVARGGREAMSDTKLRAAIFEPPDTTQVIPRRRRPSGRDYLDNPELAAHWAGTAGLAGGGLIAGGFGGGAGFGGDGGGS